MLVHYTSNPSRDGVNWFVWNMYGTEHPVFVGSMEECGMVADALNANRSNACGLRHSSTPTNPDNGAQA
jgi:hypothetical protein